MGDSNLLKKIQVDAAGNVTSLPISNFEGQGLQPTPSLKDKLMDVVAGLLGKGQDPTAMVNPSMFGGMVINPKNALLLKNAIAKDLPKDIMYLTPADKFINMAKSFIKFKYPKLYNLPEEIFTTRDGLDPASAWFSPIKNSTKGDVFLNNFNQFSTRQSVEDLAHELVHANQFRKNPNVFDNNINFGPNNFEELAKDGSLLRNAYLNQPHEVAARQGGATALRTFQKFLVNLGLPEFVTPLKAFLENK